MSNLKIIIPLVIIFVLALSGVYYLYKTQTAIDTLTPDQGEESTQSAGFNNINSTPSPSPTNGQTVGVSTQPATGTEELTIIGAGIAVLSPQANAKITSPLKISGTANVTSQVVIIEIKDSNNNIIGSGQARACIGLDSCPFKASVVFQNPNTKTGKIIVYSPSQIDSSPTNEQEIAVTFE